MREQHNQMCFSESVLAISKLADELLKYKINKTLFAREFRETDWLERHTDCTIGTCKFTNYSTTIFFNDQ